ncbi:hypothetical protein ACFYOV_32820 [Streptomyces sp. NPDC005931]|uniref:hypothetical protein n=1 Tax=Streptomyces sp. NPDC005931 TaxID=3364737 RepID=UPI003689F0D6
MPGFPPPPPPPNPKRRTNAIIIGSTVAIIAAVIATGVVVVQSTDNASKPAATTAASSSPEEDAAEPAVEEPEPEPTYAELSADDFTIELRTTRRQCFGSAGCNVTVEPELSYTGLEDIDPDAVYEITYEISGDADGPVIETAELSDETTLNYSKSLISTASASTKLSAEVTDVVERQY